MRLKSRLLSVGIMAAIGAVALPGGAALAQTAAASSQHIVRLDIPEGPASASLNALATQADVQLFYPFSLVSGRTLPAVRGEYTRDEAVRLMAQAAGLEVARQEGDTYALEDPQGGSATTGAAEVEALIVTAQKREEAIQDVPIAISAFTQKALEEQKIEGGYDLLKAIPNVTFSKSNFSSYNFSIRGIGTKAISATTDPGVAVAFNNTTLIQNRLFEQEYFDVERVEVLRGPQGTLYGRNATSGVINVISAKPNLHEFTGNIKAEVGNYDTRRLVGMVNAPLIDDVLAIRLAGAGTQRSGYDYNLLTGNAVNGRDLWGSRVSLGYEPLPQLRADLIWEHFEEDDNRSRTGKQLCHRDDGPTTIGETSVAAGSASILPIVRRALFSQGCSPGSLYDDNAFGTPNGLSYNFILGVLAFKNDLTSIGNLNGQAQTIVQQVDPYGGMSQSRDLRTIASIHDPVYRAKADVFELSIDFDLTDSLTLSSQTAYVEDEVYSFQDFNRFSTIPIFTDTSTLTPVGAHDWRPLAPGGVFCDPQLGCTDRMAGFDISQAVAKQFSQELRLQSDFDGPVNFSLGANYTEFETVADYYVMFNVLTAMAMMPPFNPNAALSFAGMCNKSSIFAGNIGPVPTDHPRSGCPHVDPNPVESMTGEGHNYFRSKNPYELESWAVFGEGYWEVADDLKFTLGLRYTNDEKTFIPVPSQVLLALDDVPGGAVASGYPEKEPILQKWGEWTGRLGVDWKPELAFTDQTLLYAFYSRGYKGGGANPPTPGFITNEEFVAAVLEQSPSGQTNIDLFSGFQPPNEFFPLLYLTAVDYGPTFEPEFVNAYEVGAKNTLLNGAMTLNATGFFYDYRDYQVSQIKDRTAVNENFDAKIWGLEFEATFSPSRNLRFNANLGRLNTRIADGETSIDIMNRTQSNPGYQVVKPWAQLPSNCVVPTHVAEAWLQDYSALGTYWRLCGGLGGFMNAFFGNVIRDPSQPGTISYPFGVVKPGAQYDLANYPEINGGAGLRADLGGNELPNAPHWTTNLGAQYGRDILDGSWRVVMRGDAYWQSQSWSRVYNAVNDKLHGWYNVNVSVRLENRDLGVDAEFYVKNLLDKSPITDAFLNSDDTGLTTNVFVLDPRLVGFNLRKTF